MAFSIGGKSIFGDTFKHHISPKARQTFQGGLTGSLQGSATGLMQGGIAGAIIGGAVGGTTGGLAGRKSYEDQQAANDALTAETNAQNARAARTQGLLDQAGASFGVGLTPEAKANARMLETQKASGQQSLFDASRAASDADYSQGLSSTRANLARAGLTGSGMESQARTDLLARNFGQTNQAQQNAVMAGTQFDANNAQGLAKLRQQIRGGDLIDTTGVRTEIAGLKNQGSNDALWSSFLGKAMPTAANSFSSYSQAKAGA
jgi:hypothetical protein